MVKGVLAVSMLASCLLMGCAAKQSSTSINPADLQRIEDAAMRAEKAAERAEVAAEKAEVIFHKSMQK